VLFYTEALNLSLRVHKLLSRFVNRIQSLNSEERFIRWH
jgi:hypothetical protein